MRRPRPTKEDRIAIAGELAETSADGFGLTDGQPVDESTASPSSTCSVGIPWQSDQTTPAASTQGREP
jgi:hypothetical protein